MSENTTRSRTMKDVMKIVEMMEREEGREKLRNQYWHLLVYVDKVDWTYFHDPDATMPGFDDIDRLATYDLSSICDASKGGCTCNGAGIKLKPLIKPLKRLTAILRQWFLQECA